MKGLIKKIPILYKTLISIKIWLLGYSRKSYSQFGEDLVLSSFCSPYTIKNGFYVDIGAYQPKKFSNTYFYYKRGWRGINVDAKPGSMEKFKKQRKRDVNLETGVSFKEQEMDFYVFEESAYNTFSNEIANDLINDGIKFDKKVTVRSMRLDNIFNKYLDKNQTINFMSIDVEGFDLEVLESNNWDKYSPEYLLVEMHDFDIETIKESEVFKFLSNKGYKLISVVYITLIFKHEV